MGNSGEFGVLIIDDNEKLCRILANDFNNIGIRSSYALESRTALEALESESFDVILLDLRLGREKGLELLKILISLYPEIPVIMVTGFGSIETAVEAVKLGAYDFLQKPVNFTKIRTVVSNAAGQKRLREENSALAGRLENGAEGFITRNSGMMAVLEKLIRLADKDFPVFITGESGTGKDLIADFVHNRSSRKRRELFKINCAALPESLLDNELFGHEKGAYTGADHTYHGIFERADGSTLFLDEIGDMPSEIQAKILRTLQNAEIRRLGGHKTIMVDVRFIAATNKDISGMLARGEFREDLLYRLNLAMVHLPPLRDRKDDIPLLVAHFLDELNTSWDVRPGPVSPAVMEIFAAYDWPGNVRELKNTIQYMAAIAAGAMIEPHDLPQRLSSSLAAAGAGAKGTAVEERKPRDILEERMIRDALEHFRYNKKRTAEELKMSRKTLYNKMARYGIE